MSALQDTLRKLEEGFKKSLDEALLFFPKSDKWEWDIIEEGATPIKADAVVPLKSLQMSAWIYSGYVASDDEDVGLRVRIKGKEKEYKFDVTTKILSDLNLANPQPGAFHYTKHNAATAPSDVFTWTPTLLGIPTHRSLILEKINKDATADHNFAGIHIALIKLE